MAESNSHRFRPIVQQPTKFLRLAHKQGVTAVFLADNFKRLMESPEEAVAVKAIATFCSTFLKAPAKEKKNGSPLPPGDGKENPVLEAIRRKAEKAGMTDEPGEDDAD